MHISTSILDPAHVDPPAELASAGPQNLTPEPQTKVAPEHRDLRRDEFWRAVPAYEKVTAAEFGDHKWQQRHTVTNVRQLRETLGSLVAPDFFADVEAGIANAP